MEIIRFRNIAALTLALSTAVGGRAMANEGIEAMLGKNCDQRPPGIELFRHVDDVKGELVLSGPEDATRLSLNPDGQGGIVFNANRILKPAEDPSRLSGEMGLFMTEMTKSGVLFDGDNRVTAVRLQGKLLGIRSECKTNE